MDQALFNVQVPVSIIGSIQQVVGLALPDSIFLQCVLSHLSKEHNTGQLCSVVRLTILAVHVVGNNTTCLIRVNGDDTDGALYAVVALQK